MSNFDEKSVKKKTDLGGKIAKAIKDNWVGYLYISPLILGLLIFTLYPLLSSLYYSFFDVNLVTPIQNFGLQNYQSILFGENSPLFWQSLKNTAVYAIVSIPLSMTLSYLLALSITKNTKRNYALRILYYLPVLIPSVVVGILWQDLLNVNYGVINTILHNYLGFEKMDFMARDTIMPTFIAIQLLSIGGGMIIWIAQFKAIPDVYYEAAQIDGANKIRCFFKITLPLSTPSIFYNLVMGVIGGFQVFGSAYVLTGGTGGDGNGLYFLVMFIYNKAFDEINFGVSSAASWMLFLIIGILTLFSFQTKKWVHYSEEM